MQHVSVQPIKIYPRLTSGRFNRLRVLMVVLTQLAFFGLPWLTWQQRQAVQFDVEQHRVTFFHLVFLPQDFIYFAALLVLCALGLFWWTALAGRLWCGYSCPQTVYTQIMLWIERWVLGDHKQRRQLDAAPMSLTKLSRKSLAHALMGGFSLITGFTLVGYFTPIRELAAGLPSLNYGPWELFWMLSYAAFTWLLAGVLREKVCLHMCPYARFQGAMFDNDTLIIAYDQQRGEPRGKQDTSTATTQGDCVDCGICVQVCPTGIDIRQGLQYECIACAACIDACDQVMDKCQKPRGLIRYSSAHAQDTQTPQRPLFTRPRVLIYSALLLSISFLSVGAVYMKTPFKVDIQRDRALLMRINNDGSLENSYSVRLSNSKEQAQRLQVTVSGLPGIRTTPPLPTLTLAPNHSQTVELQVQVDEDKAPIGSHEIVFTVRSLDHPEEMIQEKSRFISQ